MLNQPQSPKVLLFGTFDHFHPGHHFVLEEAHKRGEVWVVIARDRNVERIKNLTPSDSETQRMKNVQEAFPSAHVILGDAQDFLVPVRSIKPDLILLGYDQKLPPGVLDSDLPCTVERLPAKDPHIHKSSLRRIEN